MLTAILIIVVVQSVWLFRIERILKRNGLWMLLVASTAQAQPKAKDVPLTLQPMNADIHLAALDVHGLSKIEAKYTRYFTFANGICTTERDVRQAAETLTFWLWSIAHEPEPPQLRWVGKTLVAIRLDEFGIDPYVYGRLLYRDPYYHVLLSNDGKKGSVYASAPIPEAGPDLLKLLECTGSQTPFLRWDWFFNETSIQEGRGEPGKGTGVYDFYGVKNRDEFLKAVGADPKKAEELKRRMRAIVKKSGVARFSRQIEAQDIFGGHGYFTLDVLESGGKRNAIRNLGEDFKHDAEEGYYPGPAKLPWYYASQANGTLQNSAPDRVGHDNRTGNRTTIDVGASCIRCHLEVLRPIDNWVSDSLLAPNTAEIPYEKYQELKRLYFRNLNSQLDQDRAIYVQRLKECNGLDPKTNATQFARLRDLYDEGDLGLKETAWELGITANRWEEILLAVQAQKKLDPVLTDLRQKKRITRENWEEVFPIAILYLGGQP